MDDQLTVIEWSIELVPSGPEVSYPQIINSWLHQMMAQLILFYVFIVEVTTGCTF